MAGYLVHLLVLMLHVDDFPVHLFMVLLEGLLLVLFGFVSLHPAVANGLLIHIQVYNVMERLRHFLVDAKVGPIHKDKYWPPPWHV